jgi:AraC-like DNA-binding protein
MLDRVGIPRGALSDPNLRVTTVAACDLLEESSRATETFGLRLSERRTPSILGPLALVVREQPTVRALLHALMRYISLHNDANRHYLDEDDDIAIFRLVTNYGGSRACRQATELSLAQVLRMLRTVLGAGWSPVSTSFVHASPRSLDIHHRVFGQPVLFDQDANSLVLPRSDLDRTNPSADPAMAREIERYVESLLGSAPASVPDQVSALSYALLPMGYCNAQFIARQMGIDPRTLQRQLAEHGTTFLEIVQSTRKGLIPQYLEQSDRPLAEVADLLGFSALSAFSRWHRTHYGRSASAHREIARAQVASAAS